MIMYGRRKKCFRNGKKAVSAELRAEFVKDPFKVADRYGFKLSKSLLGDGIPFRLPQRKTGIRKRVTSTELFRIC